MTEFEVNDRVEYQGFSAVVLFADAEDSTCDISWTDEEGKDHRRWVHNEDIGYLISRPVTKPSDVTVRGELLLEAKNLIEGDRNITYGEPTQNFANIAGMWNILFAHKLKENFNSADVAQAMIALKQCRMITDQLKRDSWVDLAGYSAIGYEAAIAVD